MICQKQLLYAAFDHSSVDVGDSESSVVADLRYFFRDVAGGAMIVDLLPVCVRYYYN